jgi:hypothetical protein
MANTASSNNPVRNLGLPELKDAGIKSLGIGIAATVTVFAVQAAVVAGKALLANGKVVADSLK